MQEKKMKDRVREEIKIHTRLKHPTILELYTFFEDNDYVYLVLERAHNGTLRQYLLNNTLNEYQAASIFSQVVDGLQYLHSSNIMHRDLSPSNLLLTEAMHVKIADFGLASQLDLNSASKHTTLCGTPNYISPEVASRSAHGLPTDIWGLGCLLYTLLVGQPPFDTNGVKSTLTQVVMGSYSIPDHISADARNLIQRLLCKDSSKRIDLNEVVRHPFMMKQHQMNAIDSGIMTLSSVGKSMRSRSEERLNKFQNRMPELVVGSASMYRCQSSLNINQHQSTTPSYHSYQNSIAQQGQPELLPKRIEVEPLKSVRLQPTRHKTKNVILSIVDEPPGEVVLEFIKYKAKYGEERIQDVCRISADGLRIVLYQPNSGKGVCVQDYPPDLPTSGADHIYSFENLPEKYWKKYLYAHRFVQMVRAKTPKVTFYSEIAKCQLMENLEDFEMCLYKGGKVTRSGLFNDFQVHMDSNLNSMVQEEDIVQHAQECYEHCSKIEETMKRMALDFPSFPIIIGRRPAELEQPKELRINNTFNNYISSTQTPLRTPNINMPSFSIDQQLSLKLPALGLNNHRVPDTSSTTPLNLQRRTAIPGIGNAEHLPDGTVEIQYLDGSRVSVLTPEQGSGIRYTPSTGRNSRPLCYSENDIFQMPEVVRMKLNQLPIVLKHLMNRDGELITSTPMHNPMQLSNRLNHMKFIR